jgi:DNA-directed RNA polymerase specialized sigma subunit
VANSSTLPKPQPTDGNPEAPEGSLVPTGRQAGGRDVEAAPVVAGEPPGAVPVRGELDTTIAGGEDPPDPRPRRPARSRRAVRSGEPLEQPTKSGSPPRTELSERLIIENRGLANAAASKWGRRCSKPFEDFIGPALEGLINGCRRYDPERINPATGRPYAVSSCVCQFIEGAIKHHIRDHGYEAKLPSRWREYYPKVRRLLSEGQTLAQIVAVIPAFTEGEIIEMLGAMQQGSVSLDGGDGHQLDLCGEHRPEATDDPIAPALYDLTEAAFNNLRPADRGLLERWAADPFKKAYPSGPIFQFHNRLKAQLRGKTLQQFRQVALGIDVATVIPTPRQRRPRQPRPALASAVQPSLFGGRSQRKPHPKAVKL